MPAAQPCGEYPAPMISASAKPALPRWLLAGGVCLGMGWLRLEAQVKPVPPAELETAVVSKSPDAAPAEGPVKLAPVDVTAEAEGDGFDRTGMGSYEHQLRDAPFSNDTAPVSGFRTKCRPSLAT